MVILHPLLISQNPATSSRVRSYWSVCWHNFVSRSEGVREWDSVSTQSGDTMDLRHSYLKVFVKVVSEQLSCQEVSL